MTSQVVQEERHFEWCKRGVLVGGDFMRVFMGTYERGFEVTS